MSEANAKLLASLGVDTAQFEKGMEAAGVKTKVFADRFNNQLRETRGAVKDVSGSIEGIGRAMDGSVSGAVAGLRDLMQLIPISPWAAMAAAAAAGFAAIAKYQEKLAIDYDERVDKMVKRSKDLQKALTGAREAGQPDQIAAQMKGAETVEDIDAIVAAQKKKVAGLVEEARAKDVLAVNYQKAGFDKSAVVEMENTAADASKKAADAADQLTKIEKAAADRRDEIARDSSKERERIAKYDLDKYVETVKEKAAADKKYDEQVAKDSKRAEKERAAMFRIGASANEKEADIRSKERASIFDQGDMYQRIGGQVGQNISPEARTVDIQKQVKDEVAKLNADTMKAFAELKNSIEGNGE